MSSANVSCGVSLKNLGTGPKSGLGNLRIYKLTNLRKIFLYMRVILVLTRGDLVVEGLVVQGELVHDDAHAVVSLQLLVGLYEGSGARQSLKG